MHRPFWIVAVGGFAALSACMPAAAPPPPPEPVDVMGEVMEMAPEPVPVICENGVCAPVSN